MMAHSHSRITCLWLLIWTCTWIHPQAYSQEYDFEKLTTRDGLSHSTVYAICQDSAGYMWFGTREGLNRYDSYGIESFYPAEHGLSSNAIRSLMPAGDSGLWIGTPQGLGRFDFAQRAFRRVLIDGQEIGNINQLYSTTSRDMFICASNGLYQLSPSGFPEKVLDIQGVRSICEFTPGIYWISLTGRRIWLISDQGDIIRKIQLPIPLESGTSDQISTGVNRHLFKSRQGRIYLGTDLGLFYFDAGLDQFQPLTWEGVPISKEGKVIRSITEDSNGHLWLGTEAGVYILDPQRGTAHQIQQDFQANPSALNDNAVYSAFMSHGGIVWLGTYFGGVNYAKPAGKSFRKILPDGGIHSLNGKAVSELIQTSSGDIWIGTEDGGINILDPTTGTFRYHVHEPDRRGSLSSNNIHAIEEDFEGMIWVGTFLGGLNRYDPASGQYQVYSSDPNDPESLSNNFVYSIYEDSDRLLWIGTQSGLNVLDRTSGRVRPVMPEFFDNRFIYDIGEDREGRLWFCTRFDGVISYDKQTEEVTHFRPENTPGMSSGQIVSFFEDSRGMVWLGTLEGGLLRYDPGQETFSAMTQADGLPNNNVYQVREDDHRRLWVSTNQGLCMIHPESLEIRTYGVSHGLPTQQFNFRSSLKDRSGNLYFGTVQGLNFFHPDSLQLGSTPTRLQFTNLRLFSRPLTPGESTLLPQDINQTTHLTLQHHQNVIGIDFTAINYFSSGDLFYSYYLEGFDQQWNHTAHLRSATYTNLSPGDYVFRVQTSMTPGGPPLAERTLALRVLPPWWLSTWAWIAYGLFLLGIIILYARFSSFLHQQKLALQVERLEKEQLLEINQHKINFFTYITHEFKTPLTLIITQVEKLLRKSEGSVNEPVELIPLKRNASRLHNLIDQLMEFRRVESDHASLRLARGEILLFLKDTFDAFVPLFNKKQIHHFFTTESEETQVYFDADKLTKILQNLLSNAVKNTGELGEVRMKASLTQDAKDKNLLLLRITICDSGIGIIKSDSEKIFMPFYQSDNGRKLEKGSGIGLALVDSLLRFMNGSLHFDSHEEHGTCVSVMVPMYKAHPNPNQTDPEVIGNKSFIVNDDLFDDEPVLTPPMAEHELELLIVEDNQDLLNFLANHFGALYRVITAKDGREALDKVSKNPPDLIISDIVMPQIDGLDLCQQLKTDDHTSHIPIILLSARSDIQHKIEGLDVGADAYLPKPFNLREAELTIKNLLNSRGTLREYFLQFGAWQPEAIPVNNRDQEFLNNILRIVNEQFKNPDLTVASLAREAGVSRSLLHTKLRKIADLSASELIKTVRLKHGAAMLLAGHNVAEAAYESGFSDPNYFSRLFKKYFQVTPSAYKGEEIVT